MTDNHYLLTVRDGPTLHIWKGGKELAVIPLGVREVIMLVRSLLDRLT